MFFVGSENSIWSEGMDYFRKKNVFFLVQAISIGGS